MSLIVRPARRRLRTSRRYRPSIWGAEMYTRFTLLAATALMFTVSAFAASAVAAPVMRFEPDNKSRAIDSTGEPDESGLILVQGRSRGGGGGGGGQRAQ